MATTSSAGIRGTSACEVQLVSPVQPLVPILSNKTHGRWWRSVLRSNLCSPSRAQRPHPALQGTRSRGCPCGPAPAAAHARISCDGLWDGDRGPPRAATAAPAAPNPAPAPASPRPGSARMWPPVNRRSSATPWAAACDRHKHLLALSIQERPTVPACVSEQ